MDWDELRLSPAKLLIVIAITVVVVIELRTVLAFVGLEIPPELALVAGVLLIGGLVIWAVLPAINAPE